MLTWIALAALLLLAGVVLWGRLRSRGPDVGLPELVEPPKIADLPEARLESGVRYLGSFVRRTPDRVRTKGLASKGVARLRLSDEGVDVIRMAGPFRMTASALQGARHEDTIEGRPVDPTGAVVITWRHGDVELDSVFRLTNDSTPLAGRRDGSKRGPTQKQTEWIRKVTKLARSTEDAA